jgi:hypothetical protein
MTRLGLMMVTCTLLMVITVPTQGEPVLAQIRDPEQARQQRELKELKKEEWLAKKVSDLLKKKEAAAKKAAEEAAKKK